MKKHTLNRDLILKLLIILGFVFILVVAGTKLFGVEKGLNNGSGNSQNKGTDFMNNSTNASKDGIKAIWVTYSELPTINLPESEYKQSIETIFSNIESKGYNIAFIHVRPFADTKCNLISSTCADGSLVPYDPLKIICDAAKKHHVSVHAWINPYRVTYDLTYVMSPEMICTQSEVLYDPGNPETSKIILNYISELLKYDIDGIHIDDYFYPSDISDADTTSFTASGTTLSIEDWRRENVTNLVKEIHTLLATTNNSANNSSNNSTNNQNNKLIFSISPSADIDKNFSSYYADIRTWCSSGYVDMIIPQIYFGFKNSTMPFDNVLNTWANGGFATKACKLVIGLPGYKAGQLDQFAGIGQDEFIKDPDVIKKQIAKVASTPTCSGYAMYSYSSII